MSKFDNLFKAKPENNSYGYGYNNNHNVFKDKDIEDANKKLIYDYRNTEFPDLVKPTSSVVETISGKNYADIAATIIEIPETKNIPVLPGWTQYSRSKQSHLFEVSYGTQTKRQIELDREEAMVSNPLYIYRQMISTLECRWARYKIQYDKIHGEGSYDLMYYTEPIYDFDETFSDGEKDEKDHDNVSYDQEDYKKTKKYSVSKKQ